MIKRKTKTILVLVILLVLSAYASVHFGLPRKAFYRCIPVFLKYKYGITARANKIDGGFRSGIVMHDARLSISSASVECADVMTDIKFIDFIVPRRHVPYKAVFIKPKIEISNIQGIQLYRLPRFSFVLPTWFNTNVVISEGELTIEGFNKETPMLFSGSVGVERSNIRIDKWNIQLGDMGINIGGVVKGMKDLDLSARFTNSENMFLLKGTISRPHIYTKWGNVETSFYVEEINYDSGVLDLGKVAGNVYLSGFAPVSLEGGIVVGKDFVRMNDVAVMGLAKVNGVVSKNNVRMALKMDHASGADLAKNLPEVIRPLIKNHEITANINIFGKTSSIQAGGMIKLASVPIDLVCRYRTRNFSFHSVGNNQFSVSGGTKFGKDVQSIKVYGFFNQIEMREFLDLLGQTVNDSWEGKVSGSLFIEGELPSPKIESKLEMSDAVFGQLKFDYARINLEGAGGGVLNVENSSVVYKDVPAELKGFIDPKSKDVFSHIEIHPTSNAFIWEGLSISKDAQNKVVTLGKDLDGNVSVKFKSVVTSDPGEGDEERKPEIELNYRLNGNNNLLLRVGEDDGTVGVEKKVKF